MGLRLVGECAEKFAHLNGNPYKVLMRMCLRALDDPKPSQGIPAGLWFADWTELALAMGWDIPADPKHRDTMRNNVSKVCRELVDAGAIEKVAHPNRGVDNAAYALILDPKRARPKKGRSKPKSVDNSPTLDFDSVDDERRPQVGNVPGGEVGNVPGGEVGNVPGGEVGNPPGPIKRIEEPTEEGIEEGIEEKGEDDTRHPAQPPSQVEPVDNPPYSWDAVPEAERRRRAEGAPPAEWAGTIAQVRDHARARIQAAVAAATAPKPRHARPAPPPIDRPDRE